MKTWFDGEHGGGAKLTVELDDLQCLFQTSKIVNIILRTVAVAHAETFAFSGNPSHKIPSNVLC